MNAKQRAAVEAAKQRLDRHPEMTSAEMLEAYDEVRQSIEEIQRGLDHHPYTAPLPPHALTATTTQPMDWHRGDLVQLSPLSGPALYYRVRGLKYGCAAMLVPARSWLGLWLAMENALRVAGRGLLRVIRVGSSFNWR